MSAILCPSESFEGEKVSERRRTITRAVLDDDIWASKEETAQMETKPWESNSRKLPEAHQLIY
jgi:hypothetical protein